MSKSLDEIKKDIAEILNNQKAMNFSDTLFDKSIGCETLVDLVNTDGVCCCDMGYLCEHRKEYFIQEITRYIKKECIS